MIGNGIGATSPITIPCEVRFISANKAESEMLTVSPTRCSLSGKPRALRPTCVRFRATTRWLFRRAALPAGGQAGLPPIGSISGLSEICGYIGQGLQLRGAFLGSLDSVRFQDNAPAGSARAAGLHFGAKADGVLKLSKSSSPKSARRFWTGMSRLDTGKRPAVASR